MNNLKSDLIDIFYGLHSRIPFCCIREFIRDCKTMDYVALHRAEQLEITLQELCDTWGYAPCLPCGKKKRISKICLCDEEQRLSCKIWSWALTVLLDLTPPVQT